MRGRSRMMQVVVFAATVLWYLMARVVASSAATGLWLRFRLGDFEPLLQALLLLFLVLLGLWAFHAMDRTGTALNEAIGLPARQTRGQEWALGAAIGWGIALACVLPMVVGRALDVQLWTEPRAFLLLALNLATLAILCLANTVAIFGYGYRMLAEAIGPARAATIPMLGAAVARILEPGSESTPLGIAVLCEMLAVLLLALSWQRTHAVWLAWGLHFAAAAGVGVLFGLPLAGDNSFGSVVDTRAVGRIWLTGGGFGPGAALFTVLVLAAAIPVLIRLTDDYAWEYTRPPIVSGGYDVTIAPPAAHSAMEEAAQAKPAPLVQILPVSPAPPPGRPEE